jgi:hypothetical protein
MQLPLVTSIYYTKTLKYLMDCYGLTERDAREVIKQKIPHLLDPNYKRQRIRTSKKRKAS